MIRLACGIDVGSSSVKVAFCDLSGSVVAVACERIRRRDAREVVEEFYRRTLASLGIVEIVYAASTGEGELVRFRTGHFYGMTTHARGGLSLCPEARAVIDLGALHARALLMNEHGRVLNYRMTSQCASGSGQFLENIARYLGIALDDIGSLSQQAVRSEKISSVCAVLAETDVINMVSRGIQTAEILRGIHESMASRFVKLLRAAKATGTVIATGGLASDTGLLAAMTDEIEGGKVELRIVAHPWSLYAGAIGAALWGAHRWQKVGVQTAPAELPCSL